MLKLENLGIGYRGAKRRETVVRANIDLRLDRSEFVCLIGPNGAGKSTLLRTISGLQPPLTGKILVDGADLCAIPRKMLATRLAVVLTESVGCDLLTGWDMVAMGRYPYTNWSGTLDAADVEKIRWALKIGGAEPFAARIVAELSDGERQKVMIARALAQDTAVIVLDEPTAFLDLPRRVNLMRSLRSLAHATGKSIVLSTHDLDLALKSADKLWLMPAAGKILAGAPEDLALSGALAAAFGDENVEFDATDGSFRIDDRPRGKIRLVGEGIAATWTGRALRRARFTVSEAGSGDLPTVEISETDGGFSWHLTDHDGKKTFYELGALVRAINPPISAGHD